MNTLSRCEIWYLYAAQFLSTMVSPRVILKTSFVIKQMRRLKSTTTNSFLSRDILAYLLRLPSSKIYTRKRVSNLATITDDITYSFVFCYKAKRILELDSFMLKIAILLNRVEQLLRSNLE